MNIVLCRGSVILLLRYDAVILRFNFINDPSHEIMVLFVLCKLILQTRMCSHPMGLDVWWLVGPFVYFHTLCVRTAKALAKLRRCSGLPEPSQVSYVIITIISWAGSLMLTKWICCVFHVCVIESYLSWSMKKPTWWSVGSAKTQISLGIRPVWYQSLLCALWIDKVSSCRQWRRWADLAMFCSCIVFDFTLLPVSI